MSAYAKNYGFRKVKEIVHHAASKLLGFMDGKSVAKYSPLKSRTEQECDEERDVNVVKPESRRLICRYNEQRRTLAIIFGSIIVLIIVGLIAWRAMKLTSDDDEKALTRNVEFDCRQKPMCDASATCTGFNSIGQIYYKCVCNKGFTGNGSVCHDDGERPLIANVEFDCRQTPICDTNATCIFNASGQTDYKCVCNKGFKGNGSVCHDDGEKALMANVEFDCRQKPMCDANATCTGFNSSGQIYYKCVCNKGFTGNGSVCHDNNECNDGTATCGENARCWNTEGSYRCQCNVGYHSDGATCRDVNECDERPCDRNAECRNTNGSYSCGCKPGYQGDGKSCSDYDECRHRKHNCHQKATCTNNYGSYSCGCNPGYQGDGKWCSDYDECRHRKHDCHQKATCTNNYGSYSCRCNAGYQGDGKWCSDYDECRNWKHDCHQKATCSNNYGSYSCECKPGYQGDGKSCSDYDECRHRMYDCHQKATCTNNYGSYSCRCNPGYQGGGKWCSDYDECLHREHDCHQKARCINNEGSYSCQCSKGYKGNGKQCKASAAKPAPSGLFIFASFVVLVFFYGS